VFLDVDDASVTAVLPRGCLLVPALVLDVRLAEDRVPARLRLPDGAFVDLGERGLVVLPLPCDSRGVLRAGDLELTLTTARGDLAFLVTVDADGTPAATSGYLREGHAGR